jgi:hypothetical protein
MIFHRTSFRCPACGKDFICSTLVDDGNLKDPDPLDDVSLCIECGAFSIVDEAAPGRLRPPDDTERQEIAESVDCAMLRTAWFSVTKPASLMTLQGRGRGS